MVRKLAILLLLTAPLYAQTWSKWNGITVGSTTGNIGKWNNGAIGTTTGNIGKWNTLASPGGGGGTAPTYGTSSRGGDAFACFHTLTCVTGNITVTAGQPIFVGIVAEGQTGITGVTDTQGNTYTQLTTSRTDADVATTRTYGAVAASSGTETVTLTVTGASAYTRMFAVPITGANTSTPVGANASQTQSTPGTGANAISTGTNSIVTSTTNNLVILWVCDSQGSTGTFTAGTSPLTFTLDFSNYDSGNFTCAAEHAVIATASTTTPTITEGTGGATAQVGVHAVTYQHP